jgi:hypothetical protein
LLIYSPVDLQPVDVWKVDKRLIDLEICRQKWWLGRREVVEKRKKWWLGRREVVKKRENWWLRRRENWWLRRREEDKVVAGDPV